MNSNVYGGKVTLDKQAVSISETIALHGVAIFNEAGRRVRWCAER